MYSRNITEAITDALGDTPVVLLNGARQTGKTTLAHTLAEERGGAYLTLDDRAVLGSVLSDPDGFVRGLGSMTVIDEVQLAPDLFRAIKASVDRDRRPGCFLLTGSANVLLLPALSDSLAGRMEVIELYPLAQDEIIGRRSTFIGHAFSAQLRMSPAPAHVTKEELAGRIVAGGFPEAVARVDPKRRKVWFKAYETTILQRDIRELANISGLTELPRLLAMLAERSGGLLNLADIGRGIGIPHTTLKRYMALLETAFLIAPLHAWSSNRSSRLVKSAKSHLTDTGLSAWLTGLHTADELARSHQFGGLLESFVVGELRRMATWADLSVTVHHFRTSAGREVDVVLEDAKGRVVGIEIKATAALNATDIAGLKELRDIAGKKWVRGIVLHPGLGITPFAKDIHAVPVSALWEW